MSITMRYVSVCVCVYNSLTTHRIKIGAVDLELEQIMKDQFQKSFVSQEHLLVGRGPVIFEGV